MSIAIGIIGTDGIVLATDSRATEAFGNSRFHHDYATKLRGLSDTTGIMSVGGNKGYSQWLVEGFQELRDGLPEGVRQETSGDIRHMADAFSRFIKASYDFYTSGVPPSFQHGSGYLLEFILAGYTSNGEPHIISVSADPAEPRFSPSIEHPYYIAGITLIAEYWMSKVRDTLYKGIGISALKKLAAMVVQETAKQHNEVGGETRIATVTQAAGFQEVNAEEISRIKEQVMRIANSETLLESLVGTP